MSPVLRDSQLLQETVLCVDVVPLTTSTTTTPGQVVVTIKAGGASADVTADQTDNKCSISVVRSEVIVPPAVSCLGQLHVFLHSIWL